MSIVTIEGRKREVKIPLKKKKKTRNQRGKNIGNYLSKGGLKKKKQLVLFAIPTLSSLLRQTREVPCRLKGS